MFSSCCGCTNKKSKEKITENSDNKHENVIVVTNDEKDNLNENKDCVTSVTETGNNKEEVTIKDVEASNDVNGKLENGMENMLDGFIYDLCMEFIFLKCVIYYLVIFYGKTSVFFLVKLGLCYANLFTGKRYRFLFGFGDLPTIRWRRITSFHGGS